MSAAQRRDEIVEAAVHEFAIKGIYGTSTETIAERAGVSQPYLFRLFGTKKDLFLASVDHHFDTVTEVMRLAAETHPGAPLKAMGDAYTELLRRREELLMQMQAYAASSDDDIRLRVQRRFGELWSLVSSVSHADDEELQRFFATGMLLNVAAALDLPEIAKQEVWARICMTSDA